MGAQMIARYQAGVGPQMSVCHIYEVPADPQSRVKLSLCNRVNVVRNYKANFSFNNMNVCVTCKKKFVAAWAGRPLSPADLGVSSIED